MQKLLSYLLTLCIAPGVGTLRFPERTVNTRVPSVQARANLQISFTPNPVQQASGSCNGVTPTWKYRVTLTETAGVGIAINRARLDFYDSSNILVNSQALSGTDLVSFFPGCGTSLRVPPFGQCTSVLVCEDGLGGRTSGSTIQTFFGTDDNGNSLSFASSRLPLLPSGQLQLVLSPSKVPAGSCSGTSPSWTFAATVSEVGGLGVTISSYSIAAFDDSGNGFFSQSFTAADFARVFSACGANGSRIPANGKACGNICVSFPGRSSVPVLAVTLKGQDDNGNPVETCSTVALSAPATSPGADLLVSMTSSGIAVSQNLPVLVTIRVTNRGPEQARDVSLVTRTPATTTFNVAAVTQGSIRAPAPGAGGDIIFNVGTMGPGSSATASVALNLTTLPATPLTVSATATASTFDPFPDNNSAMTSLKSAVSEGLMVGGHGSLSVVANQSPDQPAAGTRVSYSLIVSNSGSDAIDASIIEVIPAGCTFASASGAFCSTPSPGQTGAVVCGTALEPNASQTVVVTLNVVDPPQASLSNVAVLTNGFNTKVLLPFPCGGAVIPIERTLAEDTNPNNNSALRVSVVGGRTIQLVWDQPPSTADQPTPAPLNLRVAPQTAPPQSSPSVMQREFPSNTNCALVQCNIYKSDTPNVQTTSSNLWKTVPPDQVQSTMSAAPAGSFYVVTNVWNCNGMLIESGASNEQNSSGTASSPQIFAVTVDGKNLDVVGKNFDAGSVILEDGQQKRTLHDDQNPSSLLIGKKLFKMISSGQTVTLRVQNSDASLSNEYMFARP